MRLLIALIFSLALAACSSPPPASPNAADVDKKDSAMTLETDPYLWLEDVEDEKALDWVRAQNARSLGVLESEPEFDALYKEALAILNSEARIPHGNILGGYVYNHWQDEAHKRGLWRRATLDSYVANEPQWEVLLDIDKLDQEEQQNWIFGGYQCLSPAYERCMLSLSRGGTDAAVKREFSIVNKAFVANGFEVPQAKSSVAWLDEDTLLVGTDWGDGSMTDSGYARVIKRWQRGTLLASATTLFEGKTKDVGVFPRVEKDANQTWALIVRSVTFYEVEYLLLRENQLKKLPLPLRSNVAGVLDGRAIVTLQEDWRYKGKTYAQGALVALHLNSLAAEMIYAPTPSQAVESVALGKSSLYVELLDNVQSGVLRLRRGNTGWSSQTLPMPANGVVSIAAANSSGDDLLVSYESMTVPDTLYYVNDTNGATEVTGLPAMYDARNVIVEQRFATSKDGTRVPYFVMARKDVLLKGNAPTIQYGYGGFLASILPTYYTDPGRPQHGALSGKLWVSRGGVMVLTNMRGGGEYGPAWHEAALKQNRHKAFEDFFAVGEALVADGVTTPEKLGAIGRSNGGLLMGAVMLQRPDLYAAVDCGVPLLDMMRYHKLLAGASWVGEYGDPEIAQERAYLASYSPYQNLKKNSVLPAVFFYTSTKDDRVHPGHARKMAAKMEAFDKPFLYYENIEGGHGGTANQTQLAKRTALEFAFFVRELMK